VGFSRASDPTGISRVGSVVLAGAGAGLLGAGAFRTDPVTGYSPVVSSDVPIKNTATGALHIVASVPVFLGISLGALVCAFRFRRLGKRGWASYSAASGISMLAATAVASSGFNQAPRFSKLGGLFQRAAILSGTGWLTAMSLRAIGQAEPADYIRGRNFSGS
jgi:Protein of unknown function (DUF998)